MTKLSYEINDEKINEFKLLMKAGGFSTKKELFDNSLTLIKWAMRKVQANKDVGAIDTDDNFVELNMPFLESARNSSHRLDAK